MNINDLFKERYKRRHYLTPLLPAWLLQKFKVSLCS